MITLHVWGPGFGLPSIDPHCLSAIAYLNYAVPPAEWIIIPSSNPHLSPSRILPALQNGSVWTSGLAQIIDYINQLYPTTAPDLFFDPRQRASITAFTAYVQSRGREVVDLSLYVDSKNFSAVTRPTFAGLLGWPECYYFPMMERRRARERTAHMGISTKSLAEENGDKRVIGETPGERAVREAQTGGNVDVGRTKREVQMLRVCAEFLAPLAQKVSESSGPFWFGDLPSSLDCYVFGYLSLLLIPGMPEDWAARAVQRESRLAAYVHDLRNRVLTRIVVGQAERGDLPWLGRVLLEEAKGWVAGFAGSGVEEWKDEDPMIEARNRRTVLARRREWWKSVGFVLGGVAGMAGYLVWSGIIAISAPEIEAGKEPEEDEYEADVE